MDMPLVRVAGEIDGDGVLDVDGDLIRAAGDLDVVFTHGEMILLRLRENRAADLVVVVGSGRFGLIDDGSTKLGVLHLYRNHFVGDEYRECEENQADQAPEVA